MIRKHLVLVLTLMIFVLTACTYPAIPAVPTTPPASAVPISPTALAVPTTAVATAAPTSGTNPIPADTCPTPTADLSLLMNGEDGYCFLYPAAYFASRFLIIINPSPAGGDVPGEAWLDIDIEDAAGRTAAQSADAVIAAMGPGFNITKSDILVNGTLGVIVDGLPGQDSSRVVFFVNHGRLYRFSFAPWGPSSNGQSTPLEGLYTTIINTLHFLPPTMPLPTPIMP